MYILYLRKPHQKKSHAEKSGERGGPRNIAETRSYILSKLLSNTFDWWSRFVSCGTVLLEPQFSHRWWLGYRYFYAKALYWQRNTESIFQYVGVFVVALLNSWPFSTYSSTCFPSTSLGLSAKMIHILTNKLNIKIILSLYKIYNFFLSNYPNCLLKWAFKYNLKDIPKIKMFILALLNKK